MLNVRPPLQKLSGPEYDDPSVKSRRRLFTLAGIRLRFLSCLCRDNNGHIILSVVLPVYDKPCSRLRVVDGVANEWEDSLCGIELDIISASGRDMKSVCAQSV